MNTTTNRSQGAHRARGAQTQSESSMFENWASAPTEFVQEYPVSTTLVAFAIGLGLGVVIGHSLTDSMSPKTTRSSVESFGQQVCDALRSSLPESVSRHLPV